MTELLNRDSLLEFLQSHPGEHTNIEIAEAFGLEPTRNNLRRVGAKMNSIRKFKLVTCRQAEHSSANLWRAI